MTLKVALALATLAAAQHALAQGQPERLNVNAELLAAARGGSEPAVRALLSRGADPDSRNRLGYTPLNTAARAGNEALARTLIAGGPAPGKPNLSAVTPLM
ncbi:MAG: ankyrin repeat domain-containing protein, partial [Myxococcales bacterium]